MSAGISSTRPPPSANITAPSTRPTPGRSACRTIRSATFRSPPPFLGLRWRRTPRSISIPKSPAAAASAASTAWPIPRTANCRAWRPPRRNLIWPGSMSRTISASATSAESFESEENQLAGTRPMNRYTVTVGRFTLTDFFDNNRYSHDPRTQFIGWAVMFNGAWDYPADVRGYTWGWVHEIPPAPLVFPLCQRRHAARGERPALRPPPVASTAAMSSKAKPAATSGNIPASVRVLDVSQPRQRRHLRRGHSGRPANRLPGHPS